MIPRILDLPGMIMVIGELALECGLSAYLMSYFSTEPFAPAELAANWPARHHVFENPDPWDREREMLVGRFAGDTETRPVSRVG